MAASWVCSSGCCCWAASNRTRAVTAALAPLAPAQAAAAGLLRRDGAGWAAELDLRPYSEGDTNTDTDWWVLSDLDARRQQRDHVTGVGAASLTLAAATVRRPVETLLDLGTGCGVQALHASRHAGRVTATDIAPRALAMARATFTLNELDVELLDGPWLEPVAGRRFDAIVSNPPFVPGPPRVDYVYRDSGLGGDAALAALLPTAGRPPGTGRSGSAARFLVARGRRGLAGPRAFVAAARSRRLGAAARGRRPGPARGDLAARRRTGPGRAGDPGTRPGHGWTGWQRERVQAVGFGFLTLRRTDAAPTVVFEDLPGDLADPLGPEVAGWLDRVDWLRAHAGDAQLLAARLAVAPSVLLETYAEPGTEGWAEVGSAVARRDGPQWRHEVDSPAAALLAGCQGALPLGELVELLALAHDRPTGELVAATLPAVRELVRHGLLVPAP